MQLIRPGKPHAFTLIELMMVITITGLLALFVIPNYGKSTNKAYEKAATNNLLTIYAAQKVSANSGNTITTQADTAAINANLGLGIIDNVTTYSCPTVSGSNFTCQADKATATAFRLQIDQTGAICCCTNEGPCLTASVACSPAC